MGVSSVRKPHPVPVQPRAPGVADTLHSDSTYTHLQGRPSPELCVGKVNAQGTAEAGVGSSHEVTTPQVVSRPESASSSGEDAKSPPNTSWVHTGREPLQETGAGGAVQEQLRDAPNLGRRRHRPRAGQRGPQRTRPAARNPWGGRGGALQTEALGETPRLLTPLTKDRALKGENPAPPARLRG